MLTAIPVLDTNVFNYDTWQRGDLVARSGVRRCDYWSGSDAIRETAAYYYLLITGSKNYQGAQVFSHFVHRVSKDVLQGQDLEVLVDRLNCYQLDQNGETLLLNN